MDNLYGLKFVYFYLAIGCFFAMYCTFVDIKEVLDEIKGAKDIEVGLESDFRELTNALSEAEQRSNTGVALFALCFATFLFNSPKIITWPKYAFQN